MEKIDWNKINFVIFDMDGTMVNTEPLHAKAMHDILLENGLEFPHNAESMHEQFVGMTDTVVLEALFPHLSIEVREDLIHKKNTRLAKVFKETSLRELEELTAPGIKDFFTFLKAKKIKMAVVSASENSVVKCTLEAFNLINEFEFWFGRGSTTLTKPHSEPYIKAMEKLSKGTLETVIFEDSPTGLKSAMGSGAKTIQVAPFMAGPGLKDYRTLIH